MMVSEMTGGYTLPAPIMLATVVPYVASGQKNGIFRNQLATSADLEAHNRGDR
jgi:H+/Cl- antiporter ClcA